MAVFHKTLVGDFLIWNPYSFEKGFGSVVLTMPAFASCIHMTSGAGVTFTFDEANRIRSAQAVSGGIEYYGYAPDNKRIYRMTTSGTEEVTLYGASGEELGIYKVDGLWGDGTVRLFTISSNIWFAGKLICEGSCGSQQSTPVFSDRLGTNRAGGARFRPYGDEITSTTNDRVKFATYKRDGYSGLDYADQRFYASSYGRFNSPDPYDGSVNAQNSASWNRYMYVGNDPVNLYDPTGLDPFTPFQFPCTVGAGEYTEMVQCELYSYAAPLRAVGTDAPMSRRDARQYALFLQRQVRLNRNYTNCEAMADFADGVAGSDVTKFQMMQDFGELTPSQMASASVNNSASPVFLYAGDGNGFLQQYQNTVDDGLNGNGDQGHHLAAFLQLGYQLGSTTLADAAVKLFEQGEAALNHTVMNQGDIALGIAAAQIGADLKNGNISTFDVGRAIRSLCAH